MNIKEMIRGKVHFRFYRDGNLYYATENGVVFPVPIDDIGTATFLAEDKAILFMRYIRKFIAACEREQAASLPEESEDVPLTSDKLGQMVGFVDGLSPAQREEALAYRGPENHGDPSFEKR